jgi:cysteine-rich repeat protein
MRIGVSLVALSVAIVCAACARGNSDIAPQLDAPPCVPIDDNNPCTMDSCGPDGQPGHTPLQAGSSCPGGACSAAAACEVFTCTDMRANGGETDVDCGGTCAPDHVCSDGKSCGQASDCASGVCSSLQCQVPRCGDGVRQGNEVCDDGNATNGDGCDDGAGANCRPTGCGNGVVAGTEICDDGNAVNADGCDNNCTVSACGNGVAAGTEICDDGNRSNGDGCDNNCTATACGNSILTGTEICDDGNRTNGDGCDNNCTVTACGNGVATSTEVCDDGNRSNGDGCDNNCTVTACGNGIVSTGEICDDSNLTSGDGCDNNCTVTACGNGVMTSGETCDDNNTTSGDGCDSNCTLTACGNGISTSAERCDDGNLIASDGCSSTCRVEHLVINEVDYDQIGTDSDEYVEIYNGTGASVNLAGYKLALINGGVTPGAMYTTIDLTSAGATLPDNSYLAIGSATAVALRPPGTLFITVPGASNIIQNGNPDGLVLLDSTAHTVLDSLCYGGAMSANLTSFGIGTAAGVSLVEGSRLIAVDSNTVSGSLSRRPDGRDNNNANIDWQFTSTRTIGTANQ